MTAGKFIVIEGLEGAGKSTAIAHVCAQLAGYKLPLQQVREPGGTPLAEALRSLIKQHWQERIAEQTELLLMYASRVQLVTNVIKPALAAGQWVVGDRHDLSSRAYQGGGRELGDDMLQQLKHLVLGDFKPDLTLLLDIDPLIGLQRARQRGELDRIEQEHVSFFLRTRERYLQLAAADSSIAVIDASQNIVQVQQQITAVLTQQLRQWGY
jgi:dTMP kinase